MDLEKILEKPANIVTAICLAGGALYSLVALIPKFVKSLKEALVSIKAWTEIRDSLQKIEESQKRIEENQHQKYLIQRATLDGETDKAYFESDSRGKMIWASRSWHVITGLNDNESRGSGWENGVAPEDYDRVTREFQASVDHQRNCDCDVTYIDRNGRRTMTRVHTSILRTSNTYEVTGWFGVAEIITQEK